MAYAKHIQIAADEGEQAGLDAFLAAPSSKRWPSYQAIVSKRKPDTRLKAYCNIFGNLIAEAAGVRVPNSTPVPSISLMERLRKTIKVRNEADDEDVWVPDGEGGFYRADGNEDGEDETDTDNSINDQITALTETVAALAQVIMGDKDEPVASRKAPKAEKAAGSSARKGSDRPQVVPGSGVISSGVAWKVLNASGDFNPPTNPNAPATNGQLYRLNVEGLMGDAVMAALDPTEG